MWRVPFHCIKHDDVEKALLQKGVHPGSVCSLLRESCDLKGRINLPGAPMSPDFLYARGARQVSVEGPDVWNQVLDNALREPAACWESEGIGFRLATDHRKAQKRRRGSSGEGREKRGSGAESLVLGGRFARNGWYNGSLDSYSGRHDERQ